jgi:hypothetical protein
MHWTRFLRDSVKTAPGFPELPSYRTPPASFHILLYKGIIFGRGVAGLFLLGRLFLEPFFKPGSQCCLQTNKILQDSGSHSMQNGR